jgi:toxin CcdB
MAQHDIYALPGGLLVVDLQTDLIGLSTTRVVAPLVRHDPATELGKLNPIIAVGEEVYMVRVQALAAVSQGQLRKRVGSAAEIADDLLRAVDILMRGF